MRSSFDILSRNLKITLFTVSRYSFCWSQYIVHPLGAPLIMVSPLRFTVAHLYFFSMSKYILSQHFFLQPCMFLFCQIIFELTNKVFNNVSSVKTLSGPGCVRISPHLNNDVKLFADDVKFLYFQIQQILEFLPSLRGRRTGRSRQRCRIYTGRPLWSPPEEPQESDRRNRTARRRCCTGTPSSLASQNGPRRRCRLKRKQWRMIY